MSSPSPFPPQPGHYYQDQHISGNAKVDLGNVNNFSGFHEKARERGRDADYAFSTKEPTRTVTICCSGAL
jgi:hypothetical protein